MFELSHEIKAHNGHLENKPDSLKAMPTPVETDTSIALALSQAELDALTDIVLNAPPTKLVDDATAEHLLRKLMQLQREQLFSSPE